MRRRKRDARECDAVDAIPFASLFRSSCIDPTTYTEIQQIQTQQNAQENANSMLKQTMDNQLSQLQQLQQNAINNNQAMAQKFGSYEQTVNKSATGFLEGLQLTINEALATWQQESDDFVLFVNFRMKQILYDWQSRLEYMRSSLSDAIDWTYHITDANVRNINSYYQVIVNLLQMTQRQYQQNEYSLNRQNAQLGTLIQMLLGYGPLAKQYFATAQLAGADDYIPFLGSEGFPGFGENQTMVVGFCLLDGRHYIFYVCSACPTCPNPALQAYGCRPFFRANDCPNSYVDCANVASQGSVAINGTVLEFFDPLSTAPNEVVDGTVCYAVPGKTYNAPDVTSCDNFTDIQDMANIIQEQITSYVSMMSTFFGSDPTFWRATLPEGLQITDEPSEFYSGQETSMCRQIAFGAICTAKLEMVPVHVISVIASSVVSQSLNTLAFESAYSSDPFAHLLPPDQMPFIHHINKTANIICLPPFDLVKIRGNSLSRMGSVTYLFNDTGDFSYASNIDQLYDYNPVGFAASPSLYVAAYDEGDPWCGKQPNLTDSSEPFIGLSDEGNSLCGLSRYYDIEMRGQDESGNIVLAFRAKYATMRVVYRVDVDMNMSMVLSSCPVISTVGIPSSSMNSWVCSETTCLVTLKNKLLQSIAYDVLLQSDCGDNRRGYVTGPNSYSSVNIMTCPGKAYNFSVIANGTACLQWSGTFTQIPSSLSMADGSSSWLTLSSSGIVNIDAQWAAIAHYSDMANSTDQLFSNLQDTLQRLEISTSNYTINDIVDSFNFTIQLAQLDSYLRNKTVYKALNFSTQLQLQYHNYSEFFAGLDSQMSSIMVQENITKQAFDEAWQKTIDDYNAGLDNIPPNQISTALIISIIVGCLILALALLMVCKKRNLIQQVQIVQANSNAISS